MHDFNLTWIFQGTSFRMWQLTECDCFGCDTFVYNISHLQSERFMKPIFIIVISNFDIVVYTNSKDAFWVKTVNNHAKFELGRDWACVYNVLCYFPPEVT